MTNFQVSTERPSFQQLQANSCSCLEKQNIKSMLGGLYDELIELRQECWDMNDYVLKALDLAIRTTKFILNTGHIGAESFVFLTKHIASIHSNHKHMSEAALDELGDVCFCFNRLVGLVNNTGYSPVFNDSSYIRKAINRYNQYGCIRSYTKRCS